MKVLFIILVYTSLLLSGFFYGVVADDVRTNDFSYIQMCQVGMSFFLCLFAIAMHVIYHFIIRKKKDA